MRERSRKKMIMPELSGLRVEDAQIVLRNSGFSPARVRFVESYEEDGSVTHQYPMRGQLVAPGELIELKVAKRSYIRFLPQIYQVDTAVGNSFLKEYLWIFQHIVESLTEKLDNAHEYYEPLNTPPDFLPWLASWVAMTLDIDWEEEKKRRMIRAAASLYAWRGTKHALVEMLKIFIGKEPTIEENTWPYDGFRVGVSSTVAEDTIILPPINMDHCFIVHVPVKDDEITEEMVVKVHNIINMERPAHTMYFLQFKREADKARAQHFMQIGAVSTIGVHALKYDEDESTTEEPGE